MAELDTVADLRFEGMEVPELCRWIDEIKASPGPESMRNAARVVGECVRVVVELDETLRRELGKLHIEWEGQAARWAGVANQHQTDVLRESEESLKTLASGVRAQGEGFSQVRHGLPEPAELRPAQGASLEEWSGGPFGYEQDYDTEAKQLDGQKKAARAALNAYRDNTVSLAQSYQRLPEMRPVSVTARSGGADGGADRSDDDQEHVDEYAVDTWIADNHLAAPTPPDVSQTDLGHGVDAGSWYDVGHQTDPDEGKQY